MTVQGNRIEDGMPVVRLNAAGELVQDPSVLAWVEIGPECKGRCGKRLEADVSIERRLLEQHPAPEEFIAMERAARRRQLDELGELCEDCRAKEEQANG